MTSPGSGTCSPCPAHPCIYTLNDVTRHQWNSSFEAYEIGHLRSGADVHPGPHDMRELLAFAHKTHRNLNDTDLVHMECVLPLCL